MQDVLDIESVASHGLPIGPGRVILTDRTGRCSVTRVRILQEMAARAVVEMLTTSTPIRRVN